MLSRSIFILDQLAVLSFCSRLSFSLFFNISVLFWSVQSFWLSGSAYTGWFSLEKNYPGQCILAWIKESSLKAASYQWTCSFAPFSPRLLQCVLLVTLQEAEAKQLVRDAIAAGIFNDLGSGSNIDLCVITKGKVDYVRPHDEANKKGVRWVQQQHLVRIQQPQRHRHNDISVSFKLVLISCDFFPFNSVLIPKVNFSFL